MVDEIYPSQHWFDAFGILLFANLELLTKLSPFSVDLTYLWNFITCASRMVDEIFFFLQCQNCQNEDTFTKRNIINVVLLSPKAQHSTVKEKKKKNFVKRKRRTGDETKNINTFILIFFLSFFISISPQHLYQNRNYKR